MGSDEVEVKHTPQSSLSVKVHGSVCWELTKLLNKINDVLPAIESARPGCTAGIQELCSLNNTIEKAKLLIQHCAESSKLYLAITGESIILRCERIRSSLSQSLCVVQNMVQQILAAQISVVLDYLKDAKFTIDSSEAEAGRSMIELLAQTDSSEELEFKAFQVAVISLKITTPKSLLIERRSINKLLDKIQASDSKKERILNYFLYLIKKYGKKVKADNLELKEDQSSQHKHLNSDPISAPNAYSLGTKDEYSNHDAVRSVTIASNVPPVEFCCPISARLMYDPVVIASGQSFEKVSIEKWFSEGHDTCPKTGKKLANCYMIPNSCMKDLIFNWCRKHDINLEEPSTMVRSWEPSHCSSISSLKNVSAALLDGSAADYMIHSDQSNFSFISSDASYCSDSSLVRGMDSLKDDLNVQLFAWSDDYLRCQSFSNFNHAMYLRFFYRLCELTVDIRDRALEDMKILLDGDEEVCYAMLSNGFVEALMNFLKNACTLSDVNALKTGARVFIAFLSNRRVEIPTLGEDAFQLLTSLLESKITLEALMILQRLSLYSNCEPTIAASGLLSSIVEVLDCKDHECLELGIKILNDLSSNIDLKPQIISSGCIPKLAPLLSDRRLAKLCLKLLDNFSDLKEALALIAETVGCIASIAELLEIGSREEQGHGVAILHALCSESLEYCLLVMKEGVIPSLVDISVNGNSRGKENSMKLLNLLKDLRLSGSFEASDPDSRTTCEQAAQDSVDYYAVKQPNSKSLGFFLRKMRSFLKPRSVALS